MKAHVPVCGPPTTSADGYTSAHCAACAYARIAVGPFSRIASRWLFCSPDCWRAGSTPTGRLLQAHDLDGEDMPAYIEIGTPFRQRSIRACHLADPMAPALPSPRDIGELRREEFELYMIGYFSALGYRFSGVST